jgi:hypothetical protein
MATDGAGVGAALGEVDRPATRARNAFMSGLLVGLMVQAGAAVLLGVLDAVRPRGCAYTVSLAGVLFIALAFDLTAGAIAFVRMSRSNPHHPRALAAGLLLSYVPASVAAGLFTAATFAISACAD